MREVRSKQIGDYQYRVRQLADPLATRVLTKLTKLVIPAFGAALKGIPDASKEIKLAELTTGAVGDALMAFTRELTEEDLLWLCDTLAAETEFTQDGVTWFKVTSDASHWSGRLVQKMLWLTFALEVNYADFFGGAGAIDRMFMALRSVRQSPSPSTSTGG
jgi:hypothetical protein